MTAAGKSKAVHSDCGREKAKQFTVTAAGKGKAVHSEVTAAGKSKAVHSDCGR